VVPPIADDDTPPPPERPLLRQPVGFAWGSSSSLSTAPPDLNTYQASIPIAASSSTTVFLPGQEVPLPLPALNSKGSQTKKSDGKSVKKRRVTEYSGQTGRFRLNTYDPTPSTIPPIHHGQGPYSSLYRGTQSEATGRASNVASPTPTLSSGGGHAPSVSSTPAPDDSTRKKASNQSTAKRPKQTETRTKPSTGRAKASDVKAKHSSKGKASASTRKASASVSSNNTPSASHNATNNGHYRRDYDTHVLDGRHSPGSPAHSPFPESHAPISVTASSAVGGSATGKMLRTAMNTIDIHFTSRHGSRSKTCPPTASHGDTSHSRLTEWSCRPPAGRGKNTS
jgi:hypothetical protein